MNNKMTQESLKVDQNEQKIDEQDLSLDFDVLIPLDNEEIKYWQNNYKNLLSQTKNLVENNSLTSAQIKDRVRELNFINNFLRAWVEESVKTLSTLQESELDVDIMVEGNILRNANQVLLKDQEYLRTIERENEGIANELSIEELNANQQQSEYYVWLIICISLAIFVFKTIFYPSDKGNLINHLLITILTITLILSMAKFNLLLIVLLLILILIMLKNN